MNKSEMAEKLANKCDLSKAKAAEVVNCIFDTSSGSGIIAIELDAGRKVQIPGFGTFETRHRSAREGRNPATGETIRIAAKKYPAFKAGKGLKDRVAD
ncbi:MAG: HU family DNA-binding protein [Thermoanaerobaculia bacterium]